MYVCVCVCTCVCGWVCLSACTRVCTCVYMHACIIIMSTTALSHQKCYTSHEPYTFFNNFKSALNTCLFNHWEWEPDQLIPVWCVCVCVCACACLRAFVCVRHAFVCVRHACVYETALCISIRDEASYASVPPTHPPPAYLCRKIVLLLLYLT